MERREEILAWCNLPDDEMLREAKRFADERDDTNPTLLYTVGVRGEDRSGDVAFWTREHVNYSEIYTCGISRLMKDDLDIVKGNIHDFALSAAAKYPEFAKNKSPPEGEGAVIIVVEHTKPGRKGSYGLTDGAHRLVSLCRSQADGVEAYIGHLKSSAQV